MSLPLNDFLTFLNERQRDPRLNEILFPVTKKSEAAALVLRHEKGRTKGREGGRERERKRERERERGGASGFLRIMISTTGMCVGRSFP